MLAVILMWVLLAAPVQAETYLWDYDTTNGKTLPATVNIQRSPSPTGPYVTIATIPSLPSTWVGTGVPAGWSAVYTRVANINGVSNVVSYTAPISLVGPAGPMGPAGPQGIQGPMGLTGPAGTPADPAMMLSIEARVAKLEGASLAPAPPSGNLSATVLNVDQIEIVGVNCLSLSTTGRGLQRTITCLH